MPAEPISADTLLRLVRELYVELHRAEPEAGAIVLDSRLESDLGFDSLARVELLLRVEQRSQVHLSEAESAKVQRVGDLLNAINASGRVPTGAAAGMAGVASSTAAAEGILHPPLAAPLQAVTAPTAPKMRHVINPKEAATLPQLLSWRAEQEGSATHLILLSEQLPHSLSYQTLLARATQLAQGLQHYGFGAKTTVALMLPTGCDFFFAFFGTLLSGAIPVPIYPPARAADLEEHVRRYALILTDAQVEVLISFPEAAAVARLLRLRAPNLRRVFSVADLTQTPRAPLASAAPHADSIAMLQYTSGSTGAPKGVMLTHANVLANIQAMGRHIRATPEDVVVSWLPLYHDMGLIGCWLGSLYFGCRFVIMSPLAFLGRPGRWLRAMHDYRGTISASPNFGYELAARRAAEADLDGLDLTCWRIAVNGAEPVIPETIERFQARFGPLGFRREAMSPVWGLAEAAVGVTFPPLGRGPLVDGIRREEFMASGRALPAAPTELNPLRFVSCGIPLHDYQVRVVDPSGIELPERLEGTLQFCGPSATEGYYRNADASARLRSGIWRDSGDRAYMANGEVFITGRSKDLIIRRGRHIHPEEIECLVGELAGVRKGCVAAFGSIEPATASEKLVVVAETYALSAQQRMELLKSINQCVIQCAGEPPEEIVLAAPHSVLKTSSGKLRRAATKASYEQGSLHRRSTPARQYRRLMLESVRPLLGRGARRLAHLVYGLYAWCMLLLIGLPVITATALGLTGGRSWSLAHRATSWLIRAWSIPQTLHWSADATLPALHVIVANHCSYVDSLFVTALLAQPHRFVASFSWQQLPLLHRYFRKLDTIFLPYSTIGRDSVAELQQLKDALAAGSSLVVFPEGTFTRAAGVRPFRLGAFEAAVEAGVPVIAVALSGTRSLLRDGQYLPRRVPVQIVVSPTLRPRQRTDAFAAAVDLREQARAHILRYSDEPELS